VKLDIGAGEYPHEGYATVDVNPDMNPDICAPMWAIPLPDSSVQEIISSHSLEHVTKFQVVPTLKEWRRLIAPAPDGKIIIQVPDLEWCCRAWLAHPQTDWWLDLIYGMCTTEGEQHRTGFTSNIMKVYLEEAGLALIREGVIESHGQPTLEFVCMKPVTP
jgi:predicted SAM-dependent methyltransferase